MDNDKPLVLKVNDTYGKLTDVLNNSGLPAVILRIMVRDLGRQIEEMAKKEVYEATVEYQKNQEEKEAGNEQPSNADVQS